MKKTITYTWNEDLQRVIEGTMPQDIEAAHHDQGSRGLPVDDSSEFLPRGKRRSEKWINERQAQERNERETLKKQIRRARAEEVERQHSYSDSREYGRDTDTDIPHNQNRLSASESREDYIWQILLGMVIVFLLVVYVLTHS